MELSHLPKTMLTHATITKLPQLVLQLQHAYGMELHQYAILMLVFLMMIKPSVIREQNSSGHQVPQNVLMTHAAFLVLKILALQM
jgi:hypothetical protein